MSLLDHPAARSISGGAPALPRSVAIATPERLTKNTRTSGAWKAITFGLAAVVVVLVFALQNLKSVEVTFLSLHLHLPMAILLLLVAALGGLIVFAFGAARIVQLRLDARRSRR